MKYAIGTYVVYLSPYDKDPASWEDIWRIVGIDEDGYILQNKVGGILSGFAENDVYLSSEQNPAMVFNKYKFVYACGAAGRDFKDVDIDLIEWACYYHNQAVGKEKDDKISVWNGDSDCYVEISKDWCDWSFYKGESDD